SPPRRDTITVTIGGKPLSTRTKKPYKTPPVHTTTTTNKKNNAHKSDADAAAADEPAETTSGAKHESSPVPVPPELEDDYELDDTNFLDAIIGDDGFSLDGY